MKYQGSWLDVFSLPSFYLAFYVYLSFLFSLSLSFFFLLFFRCNFSECSTTASQHRRFILLPTAVLDARGFPGLTLATWHDCVFLVTRKNRGQREIMEAEMFNVRFDCRFAKISRQTKNEIKLIFYRDIFIYNIRFCSFSLNRNLGI